MQGNKQIDIHFYPKRKKFRFIGFLTFFSSIFLYWPVLLCQLLEKKIKIREDKKRPINFSYFLDGAKRHNELFIKGVINYDVQKF
ncbi:hypothetical protein BFC23_01470 [Carnobacterium maltaromaticum]|nr:hypothetical protein BFC23_01470 [Carnobacterium maltaromaticum]